VPRQNAGTRVAISELSIPGVTPQRFIALPKSAGASTLVFTGLTDAAAPCMIGPRLVCSPSLGRQSEDGKAFQRIFTSSASGEQRLTGSAVLSDLGLIKQYASFPGQPDIEASSTYVKHPADSARSAFDGDPATSWVASTDDADPRLTIDFGKKISLSKITFLFPFQSSPATAVRISGDGVIREGLTNDKGVLAFAPMHAKRLVITFPKSPGIQISDLRIPGVTSLGSAPEVPLKTACGTGPTFTLGQQRILTRISGGTTADLLHGWPVRYTSCGRAPVLSGAGSAEQRISVPSTDPYRITSAVLRSADAKAPPKVIGRSPTIGPWTPQSRTVDVQTAGRSYLVVNENFNAGWAATLNGTRLQAVRIDGWRQGWAVPAGGSGTVRLDYEPDGTYRVVLLVGLLLVLLVIAASAVRGRGAWPASPPRGPGPWWMWPVSVIVGFWAGGFAGLILVPGACALAVFFRRRSAPLIPANQPITAAAMMGLAGAVLALGTYLQLQGDDVLSGPLTDTVPQLLGLGVLGLLIATLGIRAEERVFAAGPEPEQIKLVWR
jgi:arabinofuranan 3-O-arabinosyltransferase